VLLKLTQYFYKRIWIKLSVNRLSAFVSLDCQSADRLVHQIEFVNEWVEHFDHCVLHLKNQGFITPSFPLIFLFNGHKFRSLLLLIEVHASENILLAISKRAETNDSIDWLDQRS